MTSPAAHGKGTSHMMMEYSYDEKPILEWIAAKPADSEDGGLGRGSPHPPLSSSVQYARESRKYGDVDIASLEAISAWPIKVIE
jgi:hypothetical protein